MTSKSEVIGFHRKDGEQLSVPPIRIEAVQSAQIPKFHSCGLENLTNIQVCLQDLGPLESHQKSSNSMR